MRPAPSLLAWSAALLLLGLGSPTAAAGDDQEAGRESDVQGPSPGASEATAGSSKQNSVSRLIELLDGSSILIEYAGSVGHLGDLSPEVTRTDSRSIVTSIAIAPTESLGLALSLNLVQELTPTDTTYERELLLDDLTVDADFSLPAPGGKTGPFSWSVGLGLDAPTSKASQAASLVLAIRPSLGIELTAPLLDGLSFGYGITPAPRLHRYTTASTRTSYPCSPATGCNPGRTTDTGGRNTAFQLGHTFSLGLSALDDKFSVSLDLGLLYSRRYARSPSPRWSEETLTNPDNGDGSPTELTSTFLLDIGYRIHPSVGVSIGLWSPGGMRPDGSYYNPLVNRFTQVYFDLVFYPIDGLAEARRTALLRKQAEPPS